MGKVAFGVGREHRRKAADRLGQGPLRALDQQGDNNNEPDNGQLDVAHLTGDAVAGGGECRAHLGGARLQAVDTFTGDALQLGALDDQRAGAFQLARIAVKQ